MAYCKAAVLQTARKPEALCPPERKEARHE